MTKTNEPIPLHEALRTDAEPPCLDEFGVPDEARNAFYVGMGKWLADDIGNLWSGPDANCRHCSGVTVLHTIATRFSALSAAYNGYRTQSPIEDMLLGALLWLDMDWAGLPIPDLLDGPEDDIRNFSQSDGGPVGCSLYLTPQASVAGYKADFLLWVVVGTKYGGIVIECDGHAFHERTKEQAARDKKRDREMLAAGYPVLRFTGSEVFKDPHACVEQIKEVFSDVLHRVSKDGGLY
jgi:very-short-patch-repair endonuclease